MAKKLKVDAKKFFFWYNLKKISFFPVFAPGVVMLTLSNLEVGIIEKAKFEIGF